MHEKITNSPFNLLISLWAPRFVLLFSELFFFLAWFGLPYLRQEGVLIPYWLIGTIDSVVGYLCLTTWIGLFGLLLLLIVKRFHLGWILSSAFCIFWGTLIVLFNNSFLHLDTARFNGRIYHLAVYVDGENGRGSYTLYQCDDFGSICRGEHINTDYQGVSPFKLVVDDTDHKMSVKITYPNSGHDWVIYELSAAQ